MARPRAIARKPNLDRRWTPEVEARVLEIVAKTGSPKRAAETIGVSASTIHDHKLRDPDFGVKYGQAMDTAFHAVLGRAFDRSLDEDEPSDRLIEVLLKFRFVDRAPAFDPSAMDTVRTDGPLGLDPRVIARMSASDRVSLAGALSRYVEHEIDMRADNALTIDI